LHLPHNENKDRLVNKVQDDNIKRQEMAQNLKNEKNEEARKMKIF
jgi:hypothetical protein